MRMDQGETDAEFKLNRLTATSSADDEIVDQINKMLKTIAEQSTQIQQLTEENTQLQAVLNSLSATVDYIGNRTPWME
jgi:peptidoglycan hydrolase CwlO-like protein